MKIRYLLALVGLAISFALPTFAQQTNTPDPQLRQKLLEMAKNFEEAFNNNDASTLASLFTEDAVLVNDSGPVYGREAINKILYGPFPECAFQQQRHNVRSEFPSHYRYEW